MRNLGSVLAALLSKCDAVTNIDYALVDSRAVEGKGLRLEQSMGDTRHQEANTNWHRDLVHLSADALLEVANLIAQHGQLNRRGWREMSDLIVEAVRTNRVEASDLNEKVRQHVTSRLVE